MISTEKQGAYIGVSPVIGVILMIGITVTMGAVVGGVALGYGDFLGQPEAEVGVTFDESFRQAGPNQGDLDTLITLNTVQEADVVWVEVDGDPAIWGYDPNKGVSSSAVSSDDPGPTGTPEAYLLAPDGGGIGNTVQVGYKEEITISIVGNLDGNNSVVQSYRTEAPN